jgi:hypothetical protein
MFDGSRRRVFQQENLPVVNARELLWKFQNNEGVVGVDRGKLLNEEFSAGRN